MRFDRFYLRGPGVETYDISRTHVRKAGRFSVPRLDGLSPEATLRRGTLLLNGIGGPGTGIAKPVWWIGVGTALGFSREKGFISGDTDIDVRVALSYRDRNSALDYVAHIVRLFQRSMFKLVREMYWDGRPMQTAFVDTLNNGIEFDIYYFYPDVREGVYINYNSISLREKPARFIDNRRALPWPGHPDIIVNVPYPIEEYNEWRWGPEWRIKKHRKELAQKDLACLKPLPTGTVLTYGYFDIFHIGHVRLLERAVHLGERLFVGVVSDAVGRFRGRKTIINPEAERAAVVAALDCVDKVFLQTEPDQKERDIERFEAKVLVFGDDPDQRADRERLRGYRGVDVVFLNRTEGVSSSSFRDALGLAGSTIP